MGTTVLLLVDDDVLIQDLLGTALGEAGFETVIASDGAQALAELDADATRFRAVITDIRLGKGPDGWEVGRHARERVPGMSVIYMTGDSTHEWTSKGVPQSVVISKPFVPAQIITAVATLITEADTRGAAGA